MMKWPLLPGLESFETGRAVEVALGIGNVILESAQKLAAFVKVLYLGMWLAAAMCSSRRLKVGCEEGEIMQEQRCFLDLRREVSELLA